MGMGVKVRYNDIVEENTQGAVQAAALLILGWEGYMVRPRNDYAPEGVSIYYGVPLDVTPKERYDEFRALDKLIQPLFCPDGRCHRCWLGVAIQQARRDVLREQELSTSLE
jgi:hypothetical protein